MKNLSAPSGVALSGETSPLFNEGPQGAGQHEQEELPSSIQNRSRHAIVSGLVYLLTVGSSFSVDLPAILQNHLRLVRHF